jgi:hypothetical protein
MITSRQLQENGYSVSTNGIGYSKPLRFFASFFSILFHPLFIPAYLTCYLVFFDTYFFTGYSHQERLWVIVRVINNMVIFPLLTVLLLRGLGFIKSIYLKTQRERIVPYIASSIFFFWMYLVFRNDEQLPKIMVSFTFGVFIASSLALIANIYYKISMHAIGAGGLVGLFLVMIYKYPEATVVIPLSCALLVAGLICTSRLIVSNHTQKELYMGLLVGFICQVIAGITMIS